MLVLIQATVHSLPPGPYLHGPVVDEKAIQLGEGLACAIGVVKDNRGNTAANTTRTVRQLDSLDLADCLVEVILSEVRVGQLFENKISKPLSPRRVRIHHFVLAACFFEEQSGSLVTRRAKQSRAKQ